MGLGQRTDRDPRDRVLSPVRRIAYGDHPSQVAELSLPDGADGGRPLPVVVLLHGGFWQAAYGFDETAPLAADLAAHGLAAWNLEFRRVGDGGGWPTTFEDVAAGVDRLADLADEVGLDLDRVGVVGHSTGGHLALWTAARARLPDGRVGAGPRVRPAVAVSLAGVNDLRAAARQRLGPNAVEDLLGGPIEDVPERVRVAAPVASLPLGVPQLLVHGEHDAGVPIEQSLAYARLAAVAGDPVEVLQLPGDHLMVTEVDGPAWPQVRRWLLTRLTPSP